MTTPDEARAQARTAVQGDPDRARALARITARVQARPRPAAAISNADQWADFTRTWDALEHENERRI